MADAPLLLGRPELSDGWLRLSASEVGVGPMGDEAGDGWIALDRLFAPWGFEPQGAEVHVNLRSEDDLRCVLRLDLVDGRRVGLRVQRNVYATPAAIDDLAAVEQHYARLGVPCPAALPTLDGRTSAVVDGWLCHAETWLEGRPAVELADAIDEERLHTNLLRTAALACANPGPRVTSRSPWAFIDLFAGDERNESDQAADELRAALGRALPEDPRVSRWHGWYVRTKGAIAPAYRRLPEAVVQGDLYWGNVLVDDEHRFSGLIDFNLAGMERCLNYLLSESLEWPADIDQAVSASARRRRDETTRRRLAAVDEVYHFTDAERTLAPILHRLRMPVYWPVSRMLLQAVDAGRAREVLDWIECETLRPDAAILALFPA